MEPLYDSPKPTKSKTSMQDRVMKNPFTTIVGLALIGAGVYVLNMDLSDTLKMTVSLLLIGGGLIALGLKDRKDK